MWRFYDGTVCSLARFFIRDGIRKIVGHIRSAEIVIRNLPQRKTIVKNKVIAEQQN